MTNLTSMGCLVNLPEIRFHRDPASCWQTLEQTVTDYARHLYHQQYQYHSHPSAGHHCLVTGADAIGEMAMPFDAWWQSCCELLVGNQIDICHLQPAVGENPDLQHEFIEISNSGPLILDLSGWQIKSRFGGHQVTFPSGTLIFPQQRLRIHTHRKGKFSFNLDQSVWHQAGEQALLLNRHQGLVSSWCYGNKAHEDIAIEAIDFNDPIAGAAMGSITGLDHHFASSIKVKLANRGYHWLDISGWGISAGKDEHYTFGQGTFLPPQSTMSIDLHDTMADDYQFSHLSKMYHSRLDSCLFKDYSGAEVCVYSYGEECV